MTLRTQPQGRRPRFVQRISQWIGSPTSQERTRPRTAVQPTETQPRPIALEPDSPPDAPFTLEEIRRAYGQSHPPTTPEAKWVACTDGSVIQSDGRAMGAFAGIFTQGPEPPIDFRGRVLELPLSSTRMEAMANSWDFSPLWPANEPGIRGCTDDRSCIGAPSVGRRRKHKSTSTIAPTTRKQRGIPSTSESTPVDTGALEPWRSLGWMQGRVHPRWESMIPMLQRGHHPAAPPCLALHLVPRKLSQVSCASRHAEL